MRPATDAPLSSAANRVRESSDNKRAIKGQAVEPRRKRSGQPKRRRDKRFVKASFRLPADEVEDLRQLAERRQTTAAQVLRQSLATERYLQELLDEDADILVKTGRSARELVFPHMR